MDEAAPLHRTLAASAVVVALVALHHALVWGSVDAMVARLDHCPRLSCDYIEHYHVAAARILVDPLPPDAWFYPPTLALLLHPLTWLGLPWATWVWTVLVVVSTAALGLVTPAALRRWQPASFAPYLLVFLLSHAVHHTYKWGQVSGMLALGVLGAAWAAERDRPWVAGLLLAGVIAVKPFYALFLLPFAARRQGVAVGLAAAGAFALLVLLPAAVLGVDGTLTWYAGLRDELGRARWIAEDRNSHHVAHVLWRWVGTDPRSPGVHVVGALGGVGLLGAAWWSARRVPEHALLWSTALVCTAVPFLATTSWPHYFVWLPCCFLLAWDALRGRPGPARLPGLVLVVVGAFAGSVLAFDLAGSWEAHGEAGLPFVASVCAAGALLLALWGEARAGWPAAGSGSA
ncbi:MAG: DUF2029 domain-containing protein [Alphaproteobacteria bacterium]|nr:DUF2029 domain-containing protein [Alphaproteobacteria bacterium]